MATEIQRDWWEVRQAFKSRYFPSPELWEKLKPRLKDLLFREGKTKAVLVAKKVGEKLKSQRKKGVL